MTTKYGTYSEPGYLRPYAAATKGTSDSTEQKISSMKVGGSHSGKGRDATFLPYVALHSGDPYQDASTRIAARRRAEEATEGEPHSEKQDSTASPAVPFLLPSPLKKSSGAQAGSFYGTVGGKCIPYMYPTEDTRKRKKGEIPSQPRNFLVAPPKKGGFGFNKMTISEKQGYKGVVGEYEYLAEPLDWGKHLSEDGKAEQHHHTAPFRPTTISGTGHVFGAIEYVPQGAPLPLRGSNKKEGTAPFRPASSAKVLPQQGWPEHVPCPPPRRQTQAQQKQGSNAPWKASCGPRTSAVRSIMRMNL
eukprot:jgi/Botrbrau1/5701/Bobra.0071s0034.1